jgi:hypothetical protein
VVDVAVTRVYLGYDPRQPVAFQVAAHSAWKAAQSPVSLTRLALAQLPITRRGLTEFTYSRFLTPYLSDFTGVSIFMDSDVLVRADVTELLAYPLMQPTVPVFVVQGTKRFEWASVMVFNNRLCQTLTPKYIDNPRNSLFKFEWCSEVGALPLEWNHLVGYDAPRADAKLVHFTQGCPVWPETKDCEYSAEWWAAFRESKSTVDFQTLMGRSVHVAHMKVGA